MGARSCPRIAQATMAFVPYARGYGYGPYGPSLEEVKKIREAEEKAFKDAEAKAKELMEAEKKQYEDFVEAQKKAVDEAVAKEKEFYEKERELAIKLRSPPFAAGYGYSYGGAGYPYGAAYGY